MAKNGKETILKEEDPLEIVVFWPRNSFPFLPGSEIMFLATQEAWHASVCQHALGIRSDEI